MNTIKRIFGMLVVMSAVIFMDACKAEKGEIGPIGLTGANGTNGAVGAKGDKGDKGDAGATGTANVIYSDWINISFAGSGTSYIGNITAPKITQEMLDKADIRVYWKESGRVLTLPYAETVGTTTYTVHQRFYVGKIELKSSYALSPQLMRYVIIPGGVPSGRMASLKDMSYEEVKALYNLPD